MKIPYVFAIVMLFAGGVAHAQPDQKSAAECGTDNLSKYMNMTVGEFDQTLDSGWRDVGNIKGCESAAADLIARYRDEKLAQDIMVLDWHEGQLRAAAGEIAKAIELFERTISTKENIASQSGDRSDVLYAEATIAFLHRDRATLEAKRTELAGIPKPDWFDALAADHAKRNPKAAATMTWPPNLNVVDGFITCFDKPYGEAYSFACQPAR